jgi:hypothetical protein
MEIVVAIAVTIGFGLIGLTFVLGRNRVSKNMAMSPIIRNPTPRNVAYLGWFFLSLVPITWIIVLAGIGFR